jgi:hypothetical protein
VSNAPLAQSTTGRLYEKIAKSPWKTWADWQDEEAANLKQRTFKYTSETHAQNPYVTRDNKAIDQFVRGNSRAGVFAAKSRRFRHGLRRSRIRRTAVFVRPPENMGAGLR